MSWRDVWDIKAELEPAITALFSDAFTALSTQDPATFQKARARVEVMFVLGPSKQAQLAPSELTGLAEDVEDVWSGTVRMSLLTSADATTHGACEAFCRMKMATLPSSINGTTLLNHVIYGPIRHEGSSPVLRPEDGMYRTDMNFGLFVSIHADAWALLDQQ